MVRARPLERFGGFLKRRREAKKLSAEQVVRRMKTLGVELDNATLYNWEAGTVKAPSAAAMWALARIYDLRVDELIEFLVKNGEESGGPPPEPPSPEETEEGRLLVRIRGLRTEARRRVVELIDFEEHKQRQRPDSGNVRSAATTTSAPEEKGSTEPKPFRATARAAARRRPPRKDHRDR